MTQTIHKHLLDWQAETKLKLQGFARLIHIDRDTREPDKIAVWFELNSAMPPEIVRTFHIVATGHPIPHRTKHVGSVRMEPYILHIYEEQ